MSFSDGFSPVAPQNSFLNAAALERQKDILGKDAAMMLPELLEDFFKDCTRMITDARSALEQKNASGLRLFAHSLNSNSATYGAKAHLRLPESGGVKCITTQYYRRLLS